MFLFQKVMWCDVMLCDAMWCYAMRCDETQEGNIRMNESYIQIRTKIRENDKVKYEQ